MKRQDCCVRIYIIFISFVFMLFIISAGCGSDSSQKEECPNDYSSLPDTETGTDWTIMFYGDGDNNLEDFLLNDIEEMKSGFVNDQGLNLIVLADRITGTSCDGFYEKFTDTRLYIISHDKTTRISGGSEFPEITTTSTYEANMGDANTLKKFVQFCKNNYPADNYALILWNHGSGPMKKKSSSKNLSSIISYDSTFSAKAVCEDWTNDNDILYTAEISDTLTSNESVDLLGFDACLMGSVEVAYQYRPGNGSFEADYMVASPANEWGDGWEYEKILERLKSGDGYNSEANDVTIGGNELHYDPATSLSALTLGEVIVEEQYDSTQIISNQTLSLYDLSYVDDVKTAVDTLAVSISGLQNEFEGIRGSGSSPDTLHYFNAFNANEWISWPLFDLYDLCNRADNDSAFSSFHTEISAIMTAVDNMVKYSFADDSYDSNTYGSSFTNGTNGLSIFFPDGERMHNHPQYGLTKHWAFQWWYNAIDTNLYYATDYLYGKLTWCIDSATANDGTVDNWFEMLDSWFDDPGVRSGESYNSYQY